MAPRRKKFCLAADAIRLTRQLAAAVDHPEVAGLLALMLPHHAWRAARTAPDGSLAPLAEQDRGRWDTGTIAEGIGILQSALARDRLGEYQAQAAIAALANVALGSRTSTEQCGPQEGHAEQCRLGRLLPHAAQLHLHQVGEDPAQ
ncbi:hypothetical protein F558DRAFT_04383 [Streptomyces sp. AmelKG-A3]|nr:hypothetical protein GA0115247_107518 [Streptomyces sp. PalvLS-984]SDD58779.1 hypothetical protein F558DRAFT_04383 [Streptomyces sp. AmelKG-A3]